MKKQVAPVEIVTERQASPVEIVAEDGLAIIAVGRTALIAADANSLILYFAGTSPGLWIRAGRRRVWRFGASMREILFEAQAWIEDLEDRAARNIETAQRIAS